MAMIDDLERLSALHDKGAITAGEYEKAKARLLGLVFGGITAAVYVLLWIFVPSEDLV